MSTSFIIQVRTEAADAEELGELTTDLRQTLLRAGADDSTVAAPQRSGQNRFSAERAADPALLNVLLVSLASTNGLRAIVKAMEVWAASRRCSIHIRTPDGLQYDIDGTPNSQHAELFAQLRTELAGEGNHATPVQPPS